MGRWATGALVLLLIGCRKREAPPDAGSPVETVAEIEGVPHALTGSGTNLYWVDESVMPNVIYVRHGNAAAAKLWRLGDATSMTYRNLAANDQGAFVTYDKTVDGGLRWETMFVPADGKPPSLFIASWIDMPLAIEKDLIACGDFDKVMVAKLGEPAVIVAKTNAPPLAIALHGGRVFWLERTGDDGGELRSAPSTGAGPVTTLAKGIVLPWRRRLRMLAADDTSVYYSDVASQRIANLSPDASVEEAMLGYGEIRAVSLADKRTRTVYSGKWPITWFGIYGDRVYAWELDPSNQVQGQLWSQSLRDGSAPKKEVSSLDPMKGAQPPFVLSDKWISWTNISGLHHMPRQ